MSAQQFFTTIYPPREYAQENDIEEGKEINFYSVKRDIHFTYQVERNHTSSNISITLKTYQLQSCPNRIITKETAHELVATHTLKIPTDNRVPVIGLNFKSSIIYVTKIISKIPFYSKTGISTRKLSKLLSFYLNMILSISPDSAFKDEPWSVYSLILSEISGGRLKLYVPTSEDVNTCKQKKSSDINNMVVAVFAATVASKNFQA